eukprot:4825384-Amphidinium_carterae.1
MPTAWCCKHNFNAMPKIEKGGALSLGIVVVGRSDARFGACGPRWGQVHQVWKRLLSWHLPRTHRLEEDLRAYLCSPAVGMQIDHPNSRLTPHHAPSSEVGGRSVCHPGPQPCVGNCEDSESFPVRPFRFRDIFSAYHQVLRDCEVMTPQVGATFSTNSLTFQWGQSHCGNSYGQSSSSSGSD